MSSPERLNVLLSRARNGLIIVGNSETFLKSRGGKEIWSKFFDKIKQLGYIYEGLPVQCERHNDTKNVLKLPEDFRRLCPDGGCTEPWSVPFLALLGSADYQNSLLYSGTTMSCGIHTCWISLPSASICTCLHYEPCAIVLPYTSYVLCPRPPLPYPQFPFTH